MVKGLTENRMGTRVQEFSSSSGISRNRALRMFAEGKIVGPRVLDPAVSESKAVEADLPLNFKQAEDFLIRRALKQTGGNIAAAARLLGTHRPRVYRFIKENKPQDPE